ncbi:Inhibin beta B chain [Paragonimus heterotremus]|uniref:Inhibin beta B chain n=1 Tax=Paragonimus heterotremus TaxID=100268 RepID=A0A8J4T791_9TREM|nr:Inhibin beta B chain [Paragonimus heterotremus]
MQLISHTATLPPLFASRRTRSFPVASATDFAGYMHKSATHVATYIILGLIVFAELAHGSLMTDALIRRPRLVSPASYYLQQRPERRMARNLQTFAPPISAWTVSSDDGPVNSPEETLYRDDNLGGVTEQQDSMESQVRAGEQQSFQSGCQKSNLHGLSNCNNVERSNDAITSAQSDAEIKSIFIDSFKRRVLNQMKLREIPHVNETAWSSVPLVVQQRLKAQVEARNRILDNPVNEDEVKETILLLQQYPFQLKGVPSLTFTMKLTDTMEYKKVLQARIHIEALNLINTQDGLEMSLWEIVPPWPGEESFRNKVNDRLILEAEEWNAESSFPWRPDFTEAEEPIDLLNESSASNQAYTLIRPMIASSRFDHGTNTIIFDITSKLTDWIRYHTRNQPASRHNPIIRHLLLACPTCPDELIPINPKKVVVDIKYRHGLRRQRRLAGTSEDALTNVCQPNGHQFTCCTQHLPIKFSEIGWEKWIVFPTHVDINYCRGSCQGE